MAAPSAGAGDLANLALVFPDLDPSSIGPWLHGEDPQEVATAWRGGLEQAGIHPTTVRAWRDRVQVNVLTPGSESGVAVDVLASLTRAPTWLRDDPEGLREYVNGAVVALLGLIDLDANPLTDPPAILIARLLGDAFATGADLPVELLIPAIVDPPFSHVGCFDIENFMPRDDRHRLARQLNAVVSSPAFSAWRRGVPLDVGAWMAPTDGKTPVQVLVLAHLDDAQRMFFVSLLLHAVVAWTRRLPGTARLSALVYFDEVMGFLPPHPKNPPSKWPVLTLMKQARAVGVGVMLCTQNPVDLDYKAMSNAGTWIVGRLQTRQDRDRVREGMVAAIGASAPDDLDAHLASLAPRTFLIRDADGLRTVRSRHTMSLLRGPLTRSEISRLPRSTSPAAPIPPAHAFLRAPPPLPDGLSARWLHPEGHLRLPGDGEAWRPALYGRWEVRFNQGDWSEERTVHRLLRPGLPLDTAPEPLALEDAWLLRQLPADASARWGRLPPGLADADDVRALTRRWTEAITKSESAEGPEGTVWTSGSKTRLLGVVVVWVGPAEPPGASGGRP